MAGTQRTEVDVRILVPVALHRQLKFRALHEGMTVKAAVVAAIEAWVAPPPKRQPRPEE